MKINHFSILSLIMIFFIRGNIVLGSSLCNIEIEKILENNETLDYLGLYKKEAGEKFLSFKKQGFDLNILQQILGLKSLDGTQKAFFESYIKYLRKDGLNDEEIMKKISDFTKGRHCGI